MIRALIAHFRSGLSTELVQRVPQHDDIGTTARTTHFDPIVDDPKQKPSTRAPYVTVWIRSDVVPLPHAFPRGVVPKSSAVSSRYASSVVSAWSIASRSW